MFQNCAVLCCFTQHCSFCIHDVLTSGVGQKNNNKKTFLKDNQTELNLFTWINKMLYDALCALPRVKCAFIWLTLPLNKAIQSTSIKKKQTQCHQYMFFIEYIYLFYINFILSMKFTLYWFLNNLHCFNFFLSAQHMCV